MKNKYFAYIFALSLLVGGLIQNASAQQGEIGFSNGIRVAIKTEQKDKNADVANIYTSTATDKNIIHRVMIDRKSKIYFGYDLEVFPLEDNKQFEILIKPLSVKDVSSVVSRIGNSNDLTLRSLPKYPEKLTIQDGDTIVLDILENPQTKEKVSDFIRVTRSKQKSFTYSSNNEKPKDFTINDVQLSLTGFETYVNDEKVKFSGGGMSGSIIWTFFPNKGRFILSAVEQSSPNFQKIGLIDDKTITFNYEGVNYKFVSNNPVLGSGGKWNLWVMFDQNYKPTNTKSSSESTFTFGAANKVEYLFDNK